LLDITNIVIIVDYRVLLSASLVISAAADVLIASSLSFYLWKKKRGTGFEGTVR
jgi:hypothetical protein